MLGTHTHSFRVQRRGSTYFYRCRVPHDLVGLVGGTEIIRSLNTGNLSEARRRAATFDTAVYGLFDRMRDKHDTVEEDRLMERLCATYRRHLLAEDRGHRRRYRGDPEAEWGGLSDALERESESLEQRRLNHVRQDAQELLSEAGVKLEGDALDVLLWELARTRLQALSQMMDERDGDYTGRARVSDGGTTVETMGGADEKPSKALSEVIQLYIDDHEGKTWADRTATMAKTGLAQFLELVGDKPVRAVTKDDVRSYRKALERLPARISVVPAYRGKSLREILSMNPEPGLKPASISKLMHYVAGLFNHAERMEWIEKSPAKHLMPPKPKKAQQQRDAFTDDDLRLIFSLEFRESAFKGTAGGPHRYWIPMVMLFTGAAA